MGQSKTDTQTSRSANRLVLLIGGDLLTMLIFTWVGRSSHSLSNTDI